MSTNIILVNLLSEQTVQNYIAIQELKPRQALALTTKDYENQVDLSQELTDIPHTVLKVEPYML